MIDSVDNDLKEKSGNKKRKPDWKKRNESVKRVNAQRRSG